jgi:chorismate mutase/prephenate dehydratase
MDLKEIRAQIDDIDNDLVTLFNKRMALSAQVAEYKKANNVPIYVPSREREILLDVATRSGPETANYTRVLYSMIFELSRSYQSN